MRSIRALGTVADFQHFVATAANLGLETAIDFAVQSSPDHPWVREHPEWFSHRPDGSIKYAENPPKEYQDIYPIDFDTNNQRGLMNELLRVVNLWIDRGVKIFRVDNPHTKPVAFWEWLIESVQASHPEVMFLAEAFTRPKMMKALAKAGFTQSYTFFTWRNTKYELTEYLTEITRNRDARIFSAKLFHQHAGYSAADFADRVARPRFGCGWCWPRRCRPPMASTAASSYAKIEAVPGTEEYLNSEKYRDQGSRLASSPATSASSSRE